MKLISKMVLWLLPILMLVTPFKTKADDPELKFKTDSVSPSGMPFHSTGRFKSPFANPKHGSPCKVKVGFLLKNISNFDIKQGKFEADFFLSYTSDKPMPKGINPHFTNGILEEDDLMTKIADEPTFKLWKYHAVFFMLPDLRNYPFDRQELEIGIEEIDVGVDQIQFYAANEFTKLDSDFVMPGWEVHSLEARVQNHYYPDRFEYDDLYYPRYIFHLGIARFATNALFTVFTPALVITLVALSGVFLHGKSLEGRINASAPMLAAAVLFHYTLSQEIPATAYLTRADKLMLGVYLGLLVNLFSTWLFFFFDEIHHERIYILGKRIVPPLNMVLFILGCVL
ncbi:MAG: hypothetical protein SFU98_15435 [Leptospiraceae bacterium]|nr:hypothetical protein [Leptospiraceae bacterium]